MGAAIAVIRQSGSAAASIRLHLDSLISAAGSTTSPVRYQGDDSHLLWPRARDPANREDDRIHPTVTVGRCVAGNPTSDPPILLAGDPPGARAAFPTARRFRVHTGGRVRLAR